MQRPMLRPMGLLEIIDQAFRLYRANFWLFFGIAAVVYLPLGLLQQVPDETTQAVGTLLLGLAAQVAAAALTKAVSDRYMGEASTMGGAYAYIGSRLGAFVVTLIIMTVFVMSGALLLGVGLIVFAFWVAFVSEVFVIEGKQGMAAVWRSRFLIGQGVWAEVLVLGIVTGIIMQLVQSPAMLIIKGALTAGSQLWIVGGILIGLAQALAVPIGIVASILLYYDSRIRKEGFDLEVLARELGKSAPPSVGGGGPTPPPSPWPPQPPEQTPPPAPPIEDVL